MKEIYLTQDKVTVVDDDDTYELSKDKWHIHKSGNKLYAARNGTSQKGMPRKFIYMHTQITGYEITDHINGDTLDNRRCNLREVTRSQNAMNRGKDIDSTSGYKGVTFNKYAKKFQAQITLNGKNTYLGIFATALEAAKVYNEAAKENFGEFARLNEM